MSLRDSIETEFIGSLCKETVLLSKDRGDDFFFSTFGAVDESFAIDITSSLSESQLSSTDSQSPDIILHAAISGIIGSGQKATSIDSNCQSSVTDHLKDCANISGMEQQQKSDHGELDPEEGPGPPEEIHSTPRLSRKQRCEALARVEYKASLDSHYGVSKHRIRAESLTGRKMKYLKERKTCSGDFPQSLSPANRQSESLLLSATGGAWKNLRKDEASTGKTSALNILENPGLWPSLSSVSSSASPSPATTESETVKWKTVTEHVASSQAYSRSPSSCNTTTSGGTGDWASVVRQRPTNVTESSSTPEETTHQKTAGTRPMLCNSNASGSKSFSAIVGSGSSGLRRRAASSIPSITERGRSLRISDDIWRKDSSMRLTFRDSPDFERTSFDIFRNYSSTATVPQCRRRPVNLTSSRSLSRISESSSQLDRNDKDYLKCENSSEKVDDSILKDENCDTDSHEDKGLDVISNERDGDKLTTLSSTQFLQASEKLNWASAYSPQPKTIFQIIQENLKDQEEIRDRMAWDKSVTELATNTASLFGPDQRYHCGAKVGDLKFTKGSPHEKVMLPLFTESSLNKNCDKLCHGQSCSNRNTLQLSSVGKQWPIKILSRHSTQQDFDMLNEKTLKEHKDINNLEMFSLLGDKSNTSFMSTDTNTDCTQADSSKSDNICAIDTSRSSFSAPELKQLIDLANRQNALHTKQLEKSSPKHNTDNKLKDDKVSGSKKDVNSQLASQTVPDIEQESNEKLSDSADCASNSGERSSSQFDAIKDATAGNHKSKNLITCPDVEERTLENTSVEKDVSQEESDSNKLIAHCDTISDEATKSSMRILNKDQGHEVSGRSALIAPRFVRAKGGYAADDGKQKKSSIRGKKSDAKGISDTPRSSRSHSTVWRTAETVEEICDSVRSLQLSPQDKESGVKCKATEDAKVKTLCPSNASESGGEDVILRAQASKTSTVTSDDSKDSSEQLQQQHPKKAAGLTSSNLKSLTVKQSRARNRNDSSSSNCVPYSRRKQPAVSSKYRWVATARSSRSEQQHTGGPSQRPNTASPVQSSEGRTPPEPFPRTGGSAKVIQKPSAFTSMSKGSRIAPSHSTSATGEHRNRALTKKDDTNDSDNSVPVKAGTMRKGGLSGRPSRGSTRSPMVRSAQFTNSNFKEYGDKLFTMPNGMKVVFGHNAVNTPFNARRRHSKDRPRDLGADNSKGPASDASQHKTQGYVQTQAENREECKRNIGLNNGNTQWNSGERNRVDENQQPGRCQQSQYSPMQRNDCTRNQQNFTSNTGTNQSLEQIPGRNESRDSVRTYIEKQVQAQQAGYGSQPYVTQGHRNLSGADWSYRNSASPVSSAGGTCFADSGDVVTACCMDEMQRRQQQRHATTVEGNGMYFDTSGNVLSESSGLGTRVAPTRSVSREQHHLLRCAGCSATVPVVLPTSPEEALTSTSLRCAVQSQTQFGFKTVAAPLESPFPVTNVSAAFAAPKDMAPAYTMANASVRQPFLRDVHQFVHVQEQQQNMMTVERVFTNDVLVSDMVAGTSYVDRADCWGPVGHQPVAWYECCQYPEQKNCFTPSMASQDADAIAAAYLKQPHSGVPLFLVPRREHPGMASSFLYADSFHQTPTRPSANATFYAATRRNGSSTLGQFGTSLGDQEGIP